MSVALAAGATFMDDRTRLRGAHEIRVPDLIRLPARPLEAERAQDLDGVLRARGLGDLDQILL